MVVDVQALLQNSKAAKMVRSQIEQKRDEYTKEISHQEEALRQERDALQRQQAIVVGRRAQQKGARIPTEGQRSRPRRPNQAPRWRKSNNEALTKRSSRRC